MRGGAFFAPLALEALLILVLIFTLWGMWWGISFLRQSPHEWSRVRGFVGLGLLVGCGAFVVVAGALESVWKQGLGLTSLSATHLEPAFQDVLLIMLLTVGASLEFALIRWLWRRVIRFWRRWWRDCGDPQENTRRSDQDDKA